VIQRIAPYATSLAVTLGDVGDRRFSILIGPVTCLATHDGIRA
jgi:hypothetical protein